MRTKATLFLLVLVLALGAAAYYVKIVRTVPPVVQNQKLVFPVEMVNLDYIKVVWQTERPSQVVLEKKGNSWELTEPVRWPANFFAVNRMLTQLQYLEKVSSFPVASLAENNQSLADYSLEPPEGVLVLGRGDTRHQVRIGRTTDANNRIYLLPEGGDRIFVVDGAIRDTLRLTPDQLRSPDVFSLQEFEVRTWSIHLTEKGNLRIYLTRDGDRWKLETPIEARASTPAVRTLLEKIVTLKVRDFVPAERSDPTLLGLSSPDFRITLEGGGRREALLIGNRVPGEGAPNRYYAKLEDTPGAERTTAFVVEIGFLDEIGSAQLNLRERHILDFNPAALRSIRVTHAGESEITLQLLENGQWQVSSRSGEQGLVTMPGDPERIRQLIQELAGLQAIAEGRGFVRDAALVTELETFGLRGATAWEVEIVERAAGTDPRSQHLLLGDTEEEMPGRPVYARLAHENFVYLVDRALVDDLSFRPIDYRSRQILSLAPGLQITGLSLKRLGTTAVAFSFALSPNQTWEQALSAQSSTQSTAILALVREMRNLRARTIESAEFTAQIPGDPTGRAWTWQLEATLAPEAGTGAQASTFNLYLDDYRGGSTLMVGAANPGLVFTAEQSFIDAFAPLVFQRPGPADPASTTVPPPTADASASPDAAATR